MEIQVFTLKNNLILDLDKCSKILARFWRTHTQIYIFSNRLLLAHSFLFIFIFNFIAVGKTTNKATLEYTTTLNHCAVKEADSQKGESA